MPTPATSALGDVLARFSRLGLTSFGGPVAHLGYFRREFVERAGWLDDAAFAEIVALCSVLPGPTSSQVGIALGLRRAGPLGALVAWLAFTTPSALALTAFGLLLVRTGDLAASGAGRGALSGLAGVAAAVVLLAVATLARSLAATRRRAAIALTAGGLALGGTLAQLPAAPVLALVAGGVLGFALLRDEGAKLPAAAPPLHVSPRAGGIAAVALATLLVASAFAPRGTLAGLAALMFRAGALVFGGGHVVLPFLEGAVPAAAVDPHVFLAGYGAAQSVPGPLFTFAAFVGAVDRAPAAGALGALVATLAIFAPSFLLAAAAVPLWARLRALPRATAVLAGANAAVVGLLAGVLADPIAPALARSPIAAGAALVAFAGLSRTRVPAWAVALGGAALGAIAGSLGGA